MAEERCNVLGVGISTLTLASAVEKVIEGAARPGFSGFVTVTGVHGVMESQRDPELRRIHNRSYLSTPDGMPMVWLARWNGFGGVERVYGPDLMMEVFRRSAGTGHRHYLYGAGEGVARRLSEVLRERIPGAEVVGAVAPPFRERTAPEEEELAEDLGRKRPHFFWVGLSTPKQERFMHGFLRRHPELCRGWPHGFVMLGVGAAFDFHVGKVRQAPLWMRRSGLEWFFRLCMEPRRLWKRYLVNNTAFAGRIVSQMQGRREYRIEK